MIDCPTDSRLHQLMADTLPADELHAVDAHLTVCASCQQRLEALADVPSASAALRSHSAHRNSTFLRQAIQLLQSDRADANGSSAHIAALPPLPPSALGNLGRLGDIEIKRIIGRGGMGVVYEGWDTTLDRIVAVKVLAPHLQGDSDAKNRFLREARSAAALTHDAVVTIHAITESNGLPYLVLQYVRGESLAERLQRESKLPFDDVARIGIQVANGLAAAHDRQLVHRDIKPANILLDHDTGVARIADFGLAKKIGMESMTQEGMLAGTPAFMSPEQAADAIVDSRSDLFSLGVVLYYASSGQLPFPADSPFVLLQQIRTMEPRPLNEVNPDLPDWFCSIVHRLLAKHPDDRIASAHDLARALQQQETVPVRSDSTKHSIIKYAAAASILLAGLFAVAKFSSIGRQPVKSSFAGFQVVAANGQVNEFQQLPDAVAAAPDDGTILVCGDGPFVTSTIKIDGKRLTIAAASQSRPKFIPKSIANAATGQFIVTNADLALKGLDIDWPVPTPSHRPGDELLLRCVVAVSNGSLTINGCHVVAGENAAAVGSIGSDLRVSNSHLSASTGSCIAWRPASSAQKMTMDHCILEGHSAIVLLPHTAMPAITAAVTHNTFATKFAWRVMFEQRPPQLIDVHFDHNVVDCATVVAMTSGRNFTPTQPGPAALTDELRAQLKWRDDANVYRAGAVYLAGSKAPQVLMFTASRLKQLDQWLTFWNIAKSTSIEATIRFHGRSADSLPLRIAALDSPTGPAPPNVGANSD